MEKFEEEVKSKTEENMTNTEFENIRKELFLKMKFSDTTIKGISDSQEYKENCAYNQAIRDVIRILQEKVSD